MKKYIQNNIKAELKRLDVLTKEYIKLQDSGTFSLIKQSNDYLMSLLNEANKEASERPKNVGDIRAMAINESK